jgi:uncharacterized protein YifN (PemK superfamily)
VFLNPVEADEVSSFKAVVENNNAVVAKHDFIPSQGLWRICNLTTSWARLRLRRTKV